jgi:hypothetical protein
VLDDIDAPVEDPSKLDLRDWHPTSSTKEIKDDDDDDRPTRRSSGGTALVVGHRDLLVPYGHGVGRGSRRLSEGLLMIGSLWKSLGKSQGPPTSSIQ